MLINRYINFIVCSLYLLSKLIDLIKLADFDKMVKQIISIVILIALFSVSNAERDILNEIVSFRSHFSR